MNVIPPDKRQLLSLILKKKGLHTRITKRKDSACLPLSFAQQRLWFLSQLDPDGATYNLPIALHLAGPLNVDALQKSFDEIIRRHEVLRTVFAIENDQPVQIVKQSLKMSLPITDLSAQAEDARVEVQLLSSEEVLRPFNLSTGPLIRGSLLRLNEQEHILLLTLHHIVSDGWSMSVLVREFGSLYNAFLKSEPSPLPELSIQYADFAIWERERVKGEMLENQLSYWKRKLNGAPQILELLTDHPRPAILSYRGTSQTFQLNANLTTSLKGLCQHHKSTLFMLLLTAFNILLYRYSHQQDILIGTVTANRNRSELEELIGFFVNTLVIRTTLAHDMTFTQLLDEVRETVLESNAYQDLPFEQLVEELRPERHMSHSPIFQVMLVLQNAPRSHFELNDLTLSVLHIERHSAKFDLTLTIDEASPDQLKGAFEYNTDLFERETIDRLMGHFEQLLESIVANPEERISELRLLAAAEERQLLVEWNDTERAYPDGYCLQQLFEQQVERTPAAIALEYEEQQLSYAELNERANQVAHHLRSLGVGPEVTVAILLERSVEMVVGLLGILKAGGAYLPLDPAYPEERLRFMLADAQSRLLLTQHHLRPLVPASTDLPVLELDRIEQDLAGYSKNNPVYQVLPENLCYLIYTSGSTGKPKAVMVPHRGVVNYLWWAKAAYGLGTGAGVPLHSSLCFDLSITSLFGPLVTGEPLILLRERAGVEGLSTTLREREQLSLVKLTPAHLELLRHTLSEGAVAAATQCLVIGGEALSWEQVRYWEEQAPGTRLINEYGPTETVVGCSVYEVGGGTAQQHREVRGVPIGRPIANTEMYVLDERLRVVPVGVKGELYIGGAGLGRGYLNQPDLTAERFVPHRYSRGAGERLYRTGDVGRYLADGNIEYLGRMDQQVKVRGYRIELGEIEAVLAGAAGIREAVVVVRAGKEERPRLVAYLVPEAGAEVSVSELRGWLGERLPEYMVPAQYVILEALPLTANGKVDREALPVAEVRREQLGGAYQAPRTAAERVLAGVWSEVLGLEQVGVQDNFFELGGDSILSIQIVSRARQAGLQFTPRELFQHQTVAGLARVTEAVATAAPRARGARTGLIPLTPIQRWFFEQELVHPEHWNQALLLEVKERLKLEQLAAALRAVSAQHEMLRARFRQHEAWWQQEVRAAAEGMAAAGVTVVDLSTVGAAQRSAMIERVAGAAQGSLDLEAGLLLRVVYFELGAESAGRLLLVVHHLVVDGVSWRILLEDLQAAYEGRGRGAAALSTASYREWALGMQEYAQSEAIAAEADYWLEVAERRTERLPVDEAGGGNLEGSAASVQFSLSAAETAALLQEVPAAYHTEINDVLLTALAVSLRRWSGAAEVKVELEGHGREELGNGLDVTRSVGWFTSLYPVVLRVGASGGELGQQLQSIKEQLRGVPGRGLGYGVLKYLGGNAEVSARLRAAAGAEVVFNYLGQLDQAVSGAAIWGLAGESAGAARHQQAARPHQLNVTARILGRQLQVCWGYSRERYREQTIRQVGQWQLESLRALIAHCRNPEAGGYTPSDFPDARLDQQELDNFLATFG